MASNDSKISTDNDWRGLLGDYRVAAADHFTATSAYARAEAAADDAAPGSARRLECAAAERASDEAYERLSVATDRLLRAPAPSFDALIEKCSLAEREGRLDDTIGSIRNDIRALAARAAEQVCA